MRVKCTQRTFQQLLSERLIRAESRHDVTREGQSHSKPAPFFSRRFYTAAYRGIDDFVALKIVI